MRNRRLALAAGYARTLRSGRFRRTRRRDARKIPPGGKNRRRNAVGLSGRDARSRRPAPLAKQAANTPKTKNPGRAKPSPALRRRLLPKKAFRRTRPPLPVAADIAAERSDRPEKMQSFVQVSPASDSERIFRKIGRPASVRGRITDRNGTPLIGATVASGARQRHRNRQRRKFLAIQNSGSRYTGNQLPGISHRKNTGRHLPPDTARIARGRRAIDRMHRRRLRYAETRSTTGRRPQTHPRRRTQSLSPVSGRTQSLSGRREPTARQSNSPFQDRLRRTPRRHRSDPQPGCRSRPGSRPPRAGRPRLDAGKGFVRLDIRF